MRTNGIRIAEQRNRREMKDDQISTLALRIVQTHWLWPTSQCREFPSFIQTPHPGWNRPPLFRRSSLLTQRTEKGSHLSSRKILEDYYEVGRLRTPTTHAQNGQTNRNLKNHSSIIYLMLNIPPINILDKNISNVHAHHITRQLLSKTKTRH